MVPDALERVPEMLDTPPSQNNYALLNEAGKSPAFFVSKFRCRYQTKFSGLAKASRSSGKIC